MSDLSFGWGARLPMVLQTEAAECGLACLAMVRGYYGHPSELGELRRRVAVSLKGVNLADLIAMGERLGLASRPVRLELDELARLGTPSILHWDLSHFVVLKSVSRDSVVVHDPAAGVRKLSLAEVSRHFTGVALELTPIGGFEPEQAAPRVRVRSVLGRIAGLWRSLTHVFLLALAIEVFAVASPLFLQWTVDQALVTADRDLLLVLALGFGLLVLLRTAVSAMRGWILMVLNASLSVHSKSNLFSHLVNLPASFFEARHQGDVLSRFGSQDAILQALTSDAVEAVLDGLLAAITLAIMFVFAPTLAAIVLAGALAYGLLRWLSYSGLRRASAEAIVWAARRDSHFLESLRGIRTIKLFGGQEARHAHWLNLVVETVNRQLTSQKLVLGVRVTNTVLVGGLTILVIWLGAHRVLDNLMSIGMLLAFIAYKDQFIGRVSNLIDRSVELTMLRLHAERLADIALAPREAREHFQQSGGARQPVGVEVRGLGFRYGDNEAPVLEDLSFRIEPGESVAIVGRSGCGKTTLLKILASLLPAGEGELRVDGKPLAQFGIARWRAMIGVVMQDDQLFAGSVADNVCFFAADPDAQRIEECARLAALDGEIEAMPMGYNTLIGDMGTVLSGGQKQRLMLARALYREPSVLLLDEATSQLDVATEKTIAAALRALRTTRIIVAHRPETIRSADRVICLDDSGDAGATVRVRRRAVAGGAPAQLQLSD
jgi:ATP-binding cassette, subfamily B, bacterial CvaB/MchF/RaxB